MSAPKLIRVFRKTSFLYGLGKRKLRGRKVRRQEYMGYILNVFRVLGAIMYRARKKTALSNQTIRANRLVVREGKKYTVHICLRA